MIIADFMDTRKLDTFKKLRYRGPCGQHRTVKMGGQDWEERDSSKAPSYCTIYLHEASGRHRFSLPWPRRTLPAVGSPGVRERSYFPSPPRPPSKRPTGVVIGLPPELGAFWRRRHVVREEPRVRRRRWNRRSRSTQKGPRLQIR